MNPPGENLPTADRATPTVPLPGVGDTESPALFQPGDDGGSSKSGRGGARPGAGRKPKHEKLAEALAAKGAAPKSPAAPAPAPGVAAPPVPPPAPFDADATRRVLSVLLDALDTWDCDRFFARALAATKDEKVAAEYRKVREIAASIKGMALDDAVGLCRVNNWNLGPGWGLAVAVATVAGQKWQSEQQLKGLESAAPAP